MNITIEKKLQENIIFFLNLILQINNLNFLKQKLLLLI